MWPGWGKEGSQESTFTERISLSGDCRSKDSSLGKLKREIAW